MSNDRKCSKCQLTKNINEFYSRNVEKNSKKYTFYRSMCKECLRPINSEKMKIFREKDPIYKIANKYWTGKEEGLGISEIRNLLKCPCYYCKSKNLKIVLDKKNPNEEFNKNNTVPCCTRCKSIKTDMPLEAWNYLLKSIKEANELGLFGVWRT